MDQATLRHDVKSLFKNKIYGKAGDQVRLVSWNGIDVWIVEKDGVRFPVKSDELKFSKINVDHKN